MFEATEGAADPESQYLIVAVERTDSTSPSRAADASAVVGKAGNPLARKRQRQHLDPGRNTHALAPE